jgi:hypothetical protein
MDTCSRLEEPGGVIQMEGRPRRSFTDDYKRQAVDLVASSGRSIGSVAKELGLRFRAAALGGTAWGWAGADGGGAAPHNAGDAAVGGPRGGDRPFAARERAAAHGARHFKKLSSSRAVRPVTARAGYAESSRFLGDLAPLPEPARPDPIAVVTTVTQFLSAVASVDGLRT